MACLLALGFLTDKALSYSFSGFRSTKEVAMQGVTTPFLTVDMLGVTNSELGVAMAPRISTQPATSTAAGHGTLEGTVTSFNGFGSALVHFEWGYTGAYGTSTATQTVTSTGDVAADLDGLTHGATVYYRVVGDSGDAIAYGNQATFLVANLGNLESTLYCTLFPVAIILTIILLLFDMNIVGIAGDSEAVADNSGRKAVLILIGSVVGAIAFYIVRLLLSSTLCG